MYSITAQEKQFAIDHLRCTGKAFTDAISDLNEMQWYMRPGPGQWSAAECAQHLLETELYFFKPTIDKMLADLADPSRMEAASGKDSMVIASMESREHKIKGQPWEESSDKVIDKEALMAAFQAKRAENIAWLEGSGENFRVHFIDFPGLGALDVYQFILFISAHTTRHTGQIQDIRALQPVLSA
jgi:23S rRNA G2069 N7-methylase RlmK/C1962 C5-methylase RlmI